jgi:RES domain-containing protein
MVIIILVPGGIVGVIAYQIALWRKKRQQQLRQKSAEPEAVDLQTDGT